MIHFLKRFFDIIISSLGILVLSPLLIGIYCIIIADSKGPGFFLQQRVGKNGKDFNLFKFRSMYTGSDSKGLITIGNRDSRITRVGYFLRKYKLDELPQLLNVFLGNMSMVGPRPEVRKYVDLYTDEQKKILEIKPGLTDYASIAFSNENELLARSSNPHETYINEILPAKINLGLEYKNEMSIKTDLRILIKTFLKIIKH